MTSDEKKREKNKIEKSEIQGLKDSISLASICGTAMISRRRYDVSFMQEGFRSSHYINNMIYKLQRTDHIQVTCTYDR